MDKNRSEKEYLLKVKIFFLNKQMKLLHLEHKNFLKVFYLKKINLIV